jgi:cell division protein FtsI/penicillin-binding protein 2
VTALSSLANDGKLVRPRVTKSINYELGESQKIEKQVKKRVLKKQTSEQISRMLVKVVDTVWPERPREQFAIAAKTGTAQVPKPGGGYYDNQFNHTFFGYFPAYEPKYLVFFMARRPQDVRFASQTLKEPFFNMADFLINYYNISPDR